MAKPSWANSIVRLASADPDNAKFGTGFVVHCDAQSTHILTCAHVVTAIGGSDKILIDGHRGRLIASGEGVDIDLAIVRVNKWLDRSPLMLEPSGSTGAAIRTAGFEHLLGQEYVIRELSGVLGQQIGLESRSRTTRLGAWDVRIIDDFKLQPGHSGSPVIDEQTGSAIGILRIKHGEGERGLAISAKVARDLWPNLPSLFLSENDQERQYVDWGFAPDVSCLFGRAQEVATLRTWITQDECRVVSIIGLRGIGKTSVTLGLSKGAIARTDLNASQDAGLQDNFDFVFFRSLLNAPPVSEIMRDIITLISHQQEVSLPDSWGDQVSRLLYYLQKHRCLLILDNIEAVLQSGQRQAGAYREGYEGYGELITRVGTTNHKSCLLLNSREKPANIAAMEGKHRPVRTLNIAGVDDHSGRMILDEIGNFSGREEDWRKLIRIYGGNPLALELVAKHIAEVFFGDISKFVGSGRPVFNSLQDLLDWHLNRLSDLETEVIYWLAIDREPVTLSELNSNILRMDAKKHLTSTVEDLQRRVPLERASSRFSLQPVLIEHITNRIIETATSELLAGEWRILERHALQKALARDYVREAQIRLLVTPILENLKNVLGGQSDVEAHLREYVSKLTRQGQRVPSYAAGNILNLLCCLSPTIKGYDFSGLDIRQAYLQEVNLHDVNLAHASLNDCAFMQTFGPISSLALSPNGELVAASESNGDIHIWRIADFQIVTTLRGHINWIFALAFSPDGRMLASGGEDKVVRLWDLETASCVKEFKEHSNSVWAVTFSPNGRVLATGSEDQAIKIWNLGTGSCVATIGDHQQKVFSLEFSPDGHKLASASADHTVKVWDIYDWGDAKTLHGHGDVVRCVAFSPDSRVIASCSWDRTIKLWNADTGECISTLSGHTNSIHSVAFHPNGQTLASSGESGAVRIWSVRDGNCLATLKRHVGEVWKVAFSGDGQMLASGGYDGTLRIWDTRDWVCRNTLHGYIDWVQALAISPDAKTIVGSNGDLTIRVWDVESGRCRETLRGHTGWTFSVALSADGRRMATGSDDRTIKIWDTETWGIAKTLQAHSTWVQAVSFSEDASILASGSDDRTVKLWDVASGECRRTLHGHLEGVWSVAFAPGSRTLASGSEDHTIKLWSAVDGACLATLLGHEDRVHSVSFDSSGRRLVSCSDDKTVRVWDVLTEECLQVFEGHESWVMSAVFDTTGRYVWSGSKDMTLRVWDTASGECTSIMSGHRGGIWGVAYNEPHRMIATASEDGSVRVWDTASTQVIKVLRPLKPYENTNIYGVSGLTEAQKASIQVLGAVEDGESPMPDYEPKRVTRNTHDYSRFAADYAKLGFDGTYYLGYRDIPILLEKYAVGRRALDYGCGPGRSTRFLNGVGYNVAGVDISVEMLGQARQQDESGEYHHIRSGKIPFDDASFDVVFSSFVFIEVSTLDEMTVILEEMKRVLKSDGCIVIVTVPANGFSGNWVSFSYDFPTNERTIKSGETVKLLIRGTKVVLHDYYWADEDYARVFERVGLAVREVHKPLGRDDDGVEWLDEKTSPYIVIYVLGYPAGASG